jgi:hypothetical protein
MRVGKGLEIGTYELINLLLLVGIKFLDIFIVREVYMAYVISTKPIK